MGMMRAYVGIWFLCLWSASLYGQTQSVSDLFEFNLEQQDSVLYDARTIGFDKDGSRYLFEGDVVLIGGAYVITADRIDVAYTQKQMKATGHVVILHNEQIFTGDEVLFEWQRGDMKIRNAVLASSDKQELDRITQRILGQSMQELAYESARTLRLQEFSQGRAKLREDFRKDSSPEPSSELLERYTRLLELEKLALSAQPPNQAERDPERRKRFERRRIYWEKARAQAAKTTLGQTIYFRMEGAELSRRDEFFYEAEDASFTPCYCDEGESPAWGFQAAKIEAQQEGYVDLKHPVLMIKGLPILYLPYLKLPMKVKRQSGFLMPSFQTGEAKNGFVYTQPVFFDLAPDTDATVTTDLFEKRGTRLGVEARYEARRHSGFTIQGEGIRDRSWLDLSRQRDDLLAYHLGVQPYCTQLDAVQRQICESQVRENLQAPVNTWRGKQEWNGTYFLAPRLSLVSKGKMLSDHRYLEDLYLPENLVTAFASQENAAAFARSGIRSNFDGKDFFVALSSRYADPMLAVDRYAGQQIPLDFRIQSRYFRLFPASWLSVPIYAELQARSQLIEETSIRDRQSSRLTDVTLGDGLWQRYGLQLTTPLSHRGIVKVDHFAEAELRKIQTKLTEDESSMIRSWRTGLTLQVPMEGIGLLPAWMQGEPNPELGPTYIQHVMDWGLSFSTRPVVIRDGPYGDLKDKNGATLVYFASERKSFLADDRDVPDESMMVPHQRLTLSSSHRWQLFERGWQTIEPTLSQSEARAEAVEDLQTQAKRELMAVKARNLSQLKDVMRERPDGTVDWLIPRYRLVDSNRREPLTLNVQMSFDYQQELLRQKQIDINRQLEAEALANPDPTAAKNLRAEKVSYYSLPESWLGPFVQLGTNWRGFRLSSQVAYNLYKKTSTSLSFELGLPAFYQTQFGARYVLEKSPELDVSSDTLLFKKTKTATMGVTSTVIPWITLGVNLIQKKVEEEEAVYGSSYQIGYDDRSGCWGLRFLREKDLNQLEEDANYILQLAVIFLGNRRAGDISPAIERELKVGSGRSQ
jgi:lipopolysaccharide export system protein LptA